jgi:hypothetical protein
MRLTGHPWRLAAPSMPAPVRQDLEARILAGKSIGGPDYRARPRPAQDGTSQTVDRSAGAADGGLAFR